MSRVRSFFLREAGECLETLREELGQPVPDPVRGHAAARLLRGSAQMARLGALSSEAEVLERSLRSVSRGEASWSAEAERARRQLAVLERAVEALRTGKMEADARTETTMVGEEGGGADVVPMDELEYRGRSALERALALRGAVEAAVASDDEAVGPLLEELFDLVRLGME